LEPAAQVTEVAKSQGAREVLSGTAELRAATVDIVAHANRTLAILTANLEPEIYEHVEFLDTHKRFVLAKSFARIRVLITQPEKTMKSGNQFVQMGQRLSSYIEFRSLAQHLKPVTEAYCIADGDAIVYRADQASAEGMADTYAPEIARRYLTEFDQLWQAS
jgi:hypothetical protein